MELEGPCPYANGSETTPRLLRPLLMRMHQEELIRFKR
jgi:hypothetical protein